MDKSGIRQYQKSIKQLKQEIDLMKYNPNASLLGTTQLRDNQDFVLEDKENDWNYMNQTTNNGGKGNHRSSSTNQYQEKKLSQSQKYDHSIINLEEKMQSIKQNFIDKKKQEIIQAQNEMEQIMIKMREVEKEENNQLQEKIKQINERFEENSQRAKCEYEQKLQKYKEDMLKDIEKEKERTENSIQLKFKNLEGQIKQGNNQGLSQSLKKYQDSSNSYEPYYSQKITHSSQIKPQIPFGQIHFSTQEDTVAKCSSIKSERFTSNKRDSTERKTACILQQGYNSNRCKNEQQKQQRSRSNSSCSSNSDLDERIFRKPNNNSNNKSLNSNHPINKLIQSNYKMNNKEIFSLIKKYKKINQSYEQPPTYNQQQDQFELQQQEISRRDHLEKNFTISRQLSYQEDPLSSAAQTPNGQSSNIQFQFNSQQTQPTQTGINSLNTSYSNSLVDNFHFVNGANKRKLSNSFNSEKQQNFVKPAKQTEFYQNNSSRDTSFQFKPPLNSRKSSISQNSNNVTSRLNNTNNPTTFNGKFYLSGSSQNRKSSNATTQATKRSVSNQMIYSSNDLSDDSF